MRQGVNPEKRRPPLPAYGRHRVIIPVYLPSLDGYFEHGLDVLSLCLESLHHTVGERAAITVVSNGSAPEVVEELRARFEQGWFDELVLNRTNRGKVDAIVSVARGCFEPFITLSDCDVLFRPGWLDAVEQVFGTFPEAGFVCPFPAPALLWHHTSSAVLGALSRGELAFAKVADDLALEQLGRSFGSPHFTPAELIAAQLIVKRKGHVACVGATHVLSTLRRDVLSAMPGQPSLRAVARGSEEQWLDEPVDRLGFWRLSTPRAWACHMGNTPEPWMAEEVRAMAAAHGRSSVSQSQTALPNLGVGRLRWPRLVPLALRRGLVRQLRRDAVRPRLFRLLGHPGTDAALPEQLARVP